MMSLLAAALAFALGDPSPSSAPLAAQIAAERARNTSFPPILPTLPPRFTPHLRSVRGPEDIPDEGRIERVRRSVDINHPDFPAQILSHVKYSDAKRSYHQSRATELGDRSGSADHLARANEASEQTIKLLKILFTTPQLARNPFIEEAMYLCILELEALGRAAEMRDLQQRLLREHPNNRYQIHLDIRAAHRSLAHGELTAARRVFERAIADPDPSLHASAHLALGWSYLQSESGEAPRPDLALASFTRAIEATTRADPDTLRSAHDGLVHALAASPPAVAIATILRLTAATNPAKRLTVGQLERLALYTFARGQFLESAELYRHLLQHHPDDPQQCTWQLRLLLTAVAARDPGAQRRETLALADISQQWHDNSRHHPAHRQRCQDDARTALSALTPHDEELCAAHRRLFPDAPPLCAASPP